MSELRFSVIIRECDPPIITAELVEKAIKKLLEDEEVDGGVVAFADNIQTWRHSKPRV